MASTRDRTITVTLSDDLKADLRKYMQVEGIENQADALRTMMRVAMAMDPTTERELAARQAAYNAIRAEMYRSFQTWMWEQKKLFELAGY